MAWYKPARNRDHPGDPPPKWAPISRAGRWVLVVTVIAGTVIALLIMTARTAGAADEMVVATASPDTSPPSAMGGQRVEVPEAGLAVTLPQAWVGESSEDELDFILLAPPERFGPEVELQRILVAKGPGQERDTFTYCTLVRYAPIDITADEFLHEVFGQSDSLVIESLSEGLSRVLVNPWIDSRILDDPETIYVDHYAIGADGAVAVLMCYGVASHRDDWLSIAESLESLPAEE
jgi:hypothetical protein